MRKTANKINRIAMYNPVLANTQKRKRLVKPFDLYLPELQKFVNSNLYVTKLPKFGDKNMTDSIPMPARLSQVLVKQGLGMIASVTEKVKKAEKAKNPKKYQKEILAKFKTGTMALELKNTSIHLDSRFVEIQFPKTSTNHDFWIKFTSFPKGSFVIPAKKTRHMLDLEARGFQLRNNCITVHSDGRLAFHYQKARTPSQREPNLLGIDTGRNKLIACSNGVIESTHSTSLLTKEIIDRINRKQVNSKNAQQARLFLRNQIGYCLNNDIPWYKITDLSIEDLKSIKQGNKWGKKHQFWAVGFTHAKLQQLCEENDVRLIRIAAAYTSRTCRVCGVVDKKSRHGEDFCCTSCGFTEDADINAACNIATRGKYSSSVFKPKASYL